ncbi:hypothetical protein OESDEN_05942, partial [Oesophagostomum dentatum]
LQQFQQKTVPPKTVGPILPAFRRTATLGRSNIALHLADHLFTRTRSNERPFSTTDVLFFVQSCLSNSVFIVDVIIFFAGPSAYQAITGALPDRFGGFLINTFTIQISHFLDGLIMALFNRKTRSIIFHPHKFVKVRIQSSRVITSRVVVPEISAHEIVTKFEGPERAS